MKKPHTLIIQSGNFVAAFLEQVLCKFARGWVIVVLVSGHFEKGRYDKLFTFCLVPVPLVLRV
jgi:hypothetical protein